MELIARMPHPLGFYFILNVYNAIGVHCTLQNNRKNSLAFSRMGRSCKTIMSGCIHLDGTAQGELQQRAAKVH